MKSLNFEGPRFWYPQNFVKFYLFFVFACASSNVDVSTLSNWKVWVLASLFEGDPFTLVPLKFVKFYFFFTFAYPENFMCLVWVLKSLLFGGPVSGEHLHFVIPKFCHILSLTYIIIYSENFIGLSIVVEKLNFWRPCLREIPSFWNYQILSNLIFS